jgi:endo-alpha-1,4-polygalactosaminidase (GH114 family)
MKGNMKKIGLGRRGERTNRERKKRTKKKIGNDEPSWKGNYGICFANGAE